MVREVLKARSIVRHDIVRSWDVLCHGAVAVFPLQSAVEETKSGACASDSGGAFLHAGDGWGVVAASDNGSVSRQVPRRDEIKLGNHPSLFKITVRYGATRIGSGDKTCLDVSGKRLSPDIALTCGVEVDSAHASLSSIRGANEGRRLGHDLSEMSGSGVEVLCQGSEDGEVIR